MKTAVILHGMPSKEEYFNPTSSAQSNKHWLPWIQRQLIINGVLAQAIEMPEPYLPVYEKWCTVFEQLKIDEETILIGHSCGGGFLLRWLSENKIKVGKVALVAPWLDPAHELNTGFFNFEIDKELIGRTGGMTVFVSSDDYKVILDSVEQIKNALPDVIVEKFSDYGHFTFGGMKTDKFPELLRVLI